MKRILFFALLVAFTDYSSGGSLPALRQDTRCPSGWTPFKDEKCVMIASHAYLQTQEDAEIVCESYSNDSNPESIPKLLTIKSTEEQEFIHNFLFVKNKVIDHVWLGLKETWKSGVFEWNDGSEVYFTNWADQNITDDHHKCVQMESGEGNDPPGIWVKVNCIKRNVVVCEKIQTWTFERLQSTILTLKLQLQNTMIEHSKTKEEFQSFKETAEEEIETLKNNSGGVIPVGFTYVQLNGQAEPATMWPLATWREVSTSYAGLFFRVVGGNASGFGSIQEGSSPHLQSVEWRQGGASSGSAATVNMPLDGSWSSYVYTGTSYSSTYNGVRYLQSREEVRPRNQAMKIWVRIR